MVFGCARGATAFPIKKMAPVVDYFIHMAYDLHGECPPPGSLVAITNASFNPGQWDVGREWSMDGCPAGNCLRSHINSTQTHGSLVMMTKAGVPSHKIVVGRLRHRPSTVGGGLFGFSSARPQRPPPTGMPTMPTIA
jgi:GH18 family chitinase